MSDAPQVPVIADPLAVLGLAVDLQLHLEQTEGDPVKVNRQWAQDMVQAVLVGQLPEGVQGPAGMDSSLLAWGAHLIDGREASDHGTDDEGLW